MSHSHSGFVGKAALVTGAASGIGRATALALADRGAYVLAADIDLPGAQATANLMTTGTAMRLDVTSEADWEAAVHQLLSTCGQLDILVNSAGVSAGSPLMDMSLAEWRRVLAINLDGAFLGTRCALQAMRNRGGTIVHVSSASGIKAAGGAAAYSASKAGLCMLSKVAAKECRDSSLAVRINTVCPGGVKTPMWTTMPFFRDMVERLGSEEAAFSQLAAGPGGSFAEPDDIVAAILYLASDDARFVTGTDLVVDGGYVL
jgi:3(or 17)beta-hydroxysteroid dehydrogenase